jgi:hypothetical protein
MRGGRIVGEGVDGCVFVGEGDIPCRNGSTGVPNSRNTRYVKKVVRKDDKESTYLKIAAALLGKDYAGKYLAGLYGECSPANTKNPPNPKNRNTYVSTRRNILSWAGKDDMACSQLKKKLVKGNSISNSHKVLYVMRYPMDVMKWFTTVAKQNVTYNSTVKQIEKAVPTFLKVLQTLYQGPVAQLIHIDLHAGNMFVRENPVEFGIADFGRCVFRHVSAQGNEAAVSFYGEFLINHLSVEIFFDRYRQVPLEARILNFCYQRNHDSSSVVDLVTNWLNDPQLVQYTAGSKDIILFHRNHIVSYLLKKPLFIAMVENLQSISRKLRANPKDPIALYNSMKPDELTVMEFVLTRYGIISPVNSIIEELMNTYLRQPMVLPSGVGSNSLIRYVVSATILPYEQNAGSLAARLKSVQTSDMTQVWNSVLQAPA